MASAQRDAVPPPPREPEPGAQPDGTDGFANGASLGTALATTTIPPCLAASSNRSGNAALRRTVQYVWNVEEARSQHSARSMADVAPQPTPLLQLVPMGVYLCFQTMEIDGSTAERTEKARFLVQTRPLSSVLAQTWQCFCKMISAISTNICSLPAVTEDFCCNASA